MMLYLKLTKTSLLFLLFCLCFNTAIQAQKSPPIKGLWSYQLTLMEDGTPVEKTFYLEIDAYIMSNPQVHRSIISNPTNKATTSLAKGCLPAAVGYKTKGNKITFTETGAPQNKKLDIDALNTNKIVELVGTMGYKLRGNKLILKQDEKTLILTKYKPVSPKELIGAWTYQLNVYDLKTKKVSPHDFFIHISENNIRQGGHLLECNSCHKAYYVLEKEILFGYAYSSATCTELECRETHELRSEDNPQKMTSLFFDMTFRIEGHQLFLTDRHGNELVLTKMQD